VQSCTHGLNEQGTSLNNYTSLIDALIKAESEGKPQHEKFVFVCDTPEYLIRHAGFSALPLIIPGKIVGKACFDHGIGTSVLKRLPEIVAEPDALFKSHTHGGSVVVLTLEMKGAAPIIVPMRPDLLPGRDQSPVNVITSVYGKEGPDPRAKWIAAGLLLWENG